MSDPITILTQLFLRAVEAADPMEVIPDLLPDKPKGKLLIIGAGKASARMAEAVETKWGACDGLIITRYGYSRPNVGIEIVEASHPVPDEAGLVATRRMISMLEDLTEDDFVLTLISGGGSSLLVAPKDNISLVDLQKINDALLASGAPINEMNIVRKHLSLVKGGQLSAAAYPAKVLTLLISDVAGDNPAYIASGPTVGDDSQAIDALNILDQYKIYLPQNIRHILNGKTTILKENSTKLSNTTNKIIAAPSQSIIETQKVAQKLGFTVRIVGTDLEGEAAALAQKHAIEAIEIQKSMTKGQKPILMISGGECTVTQQISSADKKGIGGPNSEYMLSAAIALESTPGIYGISCDTDGVDGAAEVAGATISPATLSDAKNHNLDPSDFLSRHDSHSFFEKLGNQVITGPTLTNVNDFRAFLIYND